MLFAASYKRCRYLGCAALCGAGWLLVKTLVFLAIIDHVRHGQCQGQRCCSISLDLFRGRVYLVTRGDSEVLISQVDGLKAAVEVFSAGCLGGVI